jgi:hypothetical protein
LEILARRSPYGVGTSTFIGSINRNSKLDRGSELNIGDRGSYDAAHRSIIAIMAAVEL